MVQPENDFLNPKFEPNLAQKRQILALFGLQNPSNIRLMVIGYSLVVHPKKKRYNFIFYVIILLFLEKYTRAL